MDILAFTLFILLVGRIGLAELAATNIVLSINALAFMPSMGVSQGMSILVGQALGRGNPALASDYVASGCQLLLLYILAIDLLFLFAPDLVLSPFLATGRGMSPPARRCSTSAGPCCRSLPPICFSTPCTWSSAAPCAAPATPGS